jgi:hypothetical protein
MNLMEIKSGIEDLLNMNSRKVFTLFEVFID